MDTFFSHLSHRWAIASSPPLARTSWIPSTGQSWSPRNATETGSKSSFTFSWPYLTSVSSSFAAAAASVTLWHHQIELWHHRRPVFRWRLMSCGSSSFSCICSWRRNACLKFPECVFARLARHPRHGQSHRPQRRLQLAQHVPADHHADHQR